MNGRSIGSESSVAATSKVLLLVALLALTLVAWRVVSGSQREHSRAHFEALAQENLQALTTRLESFANAARGATALFSEARPVTREEFKHYVETLRLRENYPGSIGLSWIERVPSANRDDLVRRIRNDGAEDFRIHPETGAAWRDVLTFIEPGVKNRAALGLDIRFEQRRRDAADAAAMSGQVSITRPVALVQDDQRAFGFLILQPVYFRDVSLVDSAARSAAVRGWVSVPFIARSFLSKLTPSQGANLYVTVREAEQGAIHDTIFSSRTTRNPAMFEVKRTIVVFDHQWSIDWQSTPAFEQAEHSNSAAFILAGGITFTGLIGLLLLARSPRTFGNDLVTSVRKIWVIPIATFVLMGVGSVATFWTLESTENYRIRSLVQDEVGRVRSDLDRVIRSRLLALSRMSHRWTVAKGTPMALWQSDARDLIEQLPGVRQMRWIDSSFRVRWVEGDNTSPVGEGEDIRTDPELAIALNDSIERAIPYVAPPRGVGGESSFEILFPLLPSGKFDGFLSNIVSSRDFVSDAFESNPTQDFIYSLEFEGATIVQGGAAAGEADEDWGQHVVFQVYDKPWAFRLSPTRAFIESKKTSVPAIALLAGLLIAASSGVTARFILLSRLKAARLQASDARYELAVQGMSVGLWDWNLATEEMYWSPKFKDIIGLTDRMLVPHSEEFYRRLHPEDRAAIQSLLYGHLKGQNAFDVEYRLLRDDGAYIWIHACGLAEFDDRGRAIRMAGSVQDVTPKKQQETAIARSEHQLRLLIEHTPAAVAMFDRQMRYIMTSRRWMEDYGLVGQQIIGRSHYDIFPEILAMPRWLDIHQRACNGEAFPRREDSWVRANGQPEWNEWAIHPWIDTDGNVGGIVMFTEVITARKMAEAALRASEEENRAAMEYAPIGKALVYPNGRFAKVNPALCKLLGYSPAELLANDFQSITHPDDLDRDVKMLGQVLLGKISSYDLEKRYFHRDGREIWAKLSVAAVRRPTGETDFLVAQVQDISERRAIEHMKNEFISVVSHELRTPLTSIRASLGLMTGLKEEPLSPRVRRLAEISRENCERLVLLVNDILDLDKITSGYMRFDMRDENLRAVTETAITGVEAFASKHEVTIELLAPEESLEIRIDSARYIQILTNLLSNAAKFSPKGSAVQVEILERLGHAHISVRDRGPGIAEEFRGRVFGRFAQAESSATRQKGGTGLGLHITKTLVEQMHGEIGFETELGRGTTFWIRFPLVRDSRGAEQSFGT